METGLEACAQVLRCRHTPSGQLVAQGWARRVEAVQSASYSLGRAALDYG